MEITLITAIHIVLFIPIAGIINIGNINATKIPLIIIVDT